eukprot:GHVN01079485.1.p1 GENE.GHVN01079485.1~~GHVN01079485.1.p1  ORF type:complete len:240 (-),score=40.03 GHVN01079485.1:141-860(-)
MVVSCIKESERSIHEATRSQTWQFFLTGTPDAELDEQLRAWDDVEVIAQVGFRYFKPAEKKKRSPGRPRTGPRISRTTDNALCPVFSAPRKKGGRMKCCHLTQPTLKLRPDSASPIRRPPKGGQRTPIKPAVQKRESKKRESKANENKGTSSVADWMVSSEEGEADESGSEVEEVTVTSDDNSTENGSQEAADSAVVSDMEESVAASCDSEVEVDLDGNKTDNTPRPRRIMTKKNRECE